MLEYEFIKLVSQGGYDKMYSQFPLPTVISDRAFQVVWSNAAARGTYPAITGTAGLAAMLGEYEPAELLEQLIRTGSCTLADIVPFSGMALSILPIFSRGEVQGAVMHLMSLEAVPSVGSAYRVSKTAQALSTGIRESVDTIFDAMDVTALKADLLQSGWIKPNLSRIGIGGYRVLRIAENVAAYAKFQSGTVDLRFATMDLREFLYDMEDSLTAVAGEVGVPVSLRIADTPCWVSADRSYLELALFNLLHNSFYFTRSENRVDLELCVRKDAAQLTVRDRGAGISDMILADIWRPYCSFGHSGREAGIGLGLALVKAVADTHHAQVSMQSKEGGGTTVTVVIPFARPGSPVALGQTNRINRLDDRFSRLYVGLTDAAGSPYREE